MPSSLSSSAHQGRYSTGCAGWSPSTRCSTHRNCSNYCAYSWTATTRRQSSCCWAARLRRCCDRPANLFSAALQSSKSAASPSMKSARPGCKRSGAVVARRCHILPPMNANASSGARASSNYFSNATFPNWALTPRRPLCGGFGRCWPTTMARCGMRRIRRARSG